jgi:hypothetical protein
MNRRIDHQTTGVGLMLRRAENERPSSIDWPTILRALVTACGLLGFVLLVTAFWGAR